MGPRLWYSNRFASNRRVLGPMTIVFGAAADCSLAARLGVSPMTPRSRESPEPTRSPTTTRPVPIPIRIVLVRLRVPKIAQYAVAHIFGDITIKSGYGLGNTFVISPDDVPEVLRIHAGRQCR